MRLLKRKKNQGQKRPNSSTVQLLLSLCIVVGTVTGSGIFFKNNSLISWAQGRPWLVMGAWFAGTIIVLCITLSYTAIARASHKSNTGVAQFAHELIGPRTGWHTKINWLLFYFSFTLVTVSSYCAKFLVELFSQTLSSNVQTTLVLVITFAVLVVFLALNLLAERLGFWFQINVTFVHLLPLLFLAVVGLITVFAFHNSNFWNANLVQKLNPDAVQTTHGWNTFVILIFIIPGTLFAFDGFLNVTNLSENVKRHHVSYALAGGMFFVAVLYILVTLALLNTGTIAVDNAIIQFLGGNPSHLTPFFKGVKLTMRLFVVLAVLAGINGYCIAWIKAGRAAIKKPSNLKLAKVFTVAIVLVSFPLVVTTVVLQCTKSYDNPQNAVFDLFSNVFTVIAYSVYVAVMLAGLINHHKNKIKKTYPPWFTTVTLLAIFGVSAILFYQFFYSFLYTSIVNPTGKTQGILMWVYALMGFFYLGVYAGLPFLVRRWYKNVFVPPR